MIGDNGLITAAEQNQDNVSFANHALTLGRVETTAYGVGGDDTITTLEGSDIILGGEGGDTIVASDLTNLLATDHNIVLGDDGYIDYDNDQALSSNPTDASDIDEIFSTSTDANGGADTIDTGDGDDIVIGGRFDDTINVGNGDNLVIGDSGRILSLIHI